MSMNVSNVDQVMTGSAATVLTATSPSQITILKATALNTDSVARTLTLYRIPLAGTAAASNTLISALSIGAGETVTLPLSGHTLINSQFIQGLASTTNVVNLSISYVQTP